MHLVPSATAIFVIFTFRMSQRYLLPAILDAQNACFEIDRGIRNACCTQARYIMPPGRRMRPAASRLRRWRVFVHEAQKRRGRRLSLPRPSVLTNSRRIAPWPTFLPGVSVYDHCCMLDGETPIARKVTYRWGRADEQHPNFAGNLL
ncbi:hypothetical protein KCP73_20775 [Salmonella enterica subsp. enterica]|nr:hypothetical protein KCP73_20775 [Salmonella enterica subsp. enterica]